MLGCFLQKISGDFEAPLSIYSPCAILFANVLASSILTIEFGKKLCHQYPARDKLGNSRHKVYLD